MNKISVFCGSSLGNEGLFQTAAQQLGEALAQRNIGLVYGGANVGLMGIVANAVLENGGEVFGVIPKFLQSKEIAHQHLTALILVESMHERKTKMNELCDAVIALPGGYGTLEELFEMLTWAQLSLHQKPVSILNIGGFYNDLLAMVEEMTRKGFLSKQYQEMLIVEEDIDVLLDRIHAYVPPSTKWSKV